VPVCASVCQCVPVCASVCEYVHALRRFFVPNLTMLVTYHDCLWGLILSISPYRVVSHRVVVSFVSRCLLL
jgi:hypothetical protein